MKRFYAVRETANEKVAAGNGDFTAEINKLTEYGKDAASRLSKGYAQDLAMWKKAGQQLPMVQAKAVLEELEKFEL